MIAEAFVYLMSLAEAPPGFRRNLGEAVGLWARGQRQANAWVPHVANTRGLIDTTIDDIGSRRTVAVLGAGPLFDVPLEALARTFRTVLLVDHAHLWPARRRTRRYANVRRVWRDLSTAAAADPLGFLGATPDLDWVVSVNLLSQLARVAPEGRERHEVDAHLDALAALDCRATLVTDLDYRIVGRGGEVREEQDLMHGRAMPAPDLGWKWEVAPFGEEAPDTRRVHRVGAWLDWRRAAIRIPA